MVIFLLLIGQQTFLASVSAPDHSTASDAESPIVIYITDDGAIRFDSPSSAPVPVERISDVVLERLAVRPDQPVAALRSASMSGG